MTQFEAFVARCLATNTPVVVQRVINHQGNREVGTVARIRDGVVYIMVGTSIIQGKVNTSSYTPFVIGEWVMTERQYHQMHSALNGGEIKNMMALKTMVARLCHASKVLNQPFVVYKRLPSGALVNGVVDRAAENGMVFIKDGPMAPVELFPTRWHGADRWYIDQKDDFIQTVEACLKEHYSVLAKERFAGLLEQLPGSRAATARHLYRTVPGENVIGIVLNSESVGSETVGYSVNGMTNNIEWDCSMGHCEWDIVE